MKITEITGFTFVNTEPAVVGQEVTNMDMLDARLGEITLDDGTHLVGMCTRLVDQGVGVIAAEEVVTSIPSPTVPGPESTSAVTEEVAPKVTPAVKG